MMNDESLMPFGKYKRSKLKDVPDDYMYWLYTNGTNNVELMEYLEDNIDAIKANINKSKFYNKTE